MNLYLVPRGDRNGILRDRIREFDELVQSEVSEMFEQASELLWQIADARGLLDGFVDVAIDEHAWLYYGDADTPRISTVDPDQGTDKAYVFLTLCVIGDNGERFVLGVRQVASDQEVYEAMKDLVEKADDRLHVRNVFGDRGFYGTLKAQVLLETGVYFVIRSQKGQKSE